MTSNTALENIEVCSSCGRDHSHQRSELPVGSAIESLIGIATLDTVLAPGSTGVVIGHCVDGRAIIQFHIDGSIHTFHHHEEAISNQGDKVNLPAPKVERSIISALFADLHTTRVQRRAGARQ